MFMRWCQYTVPTLTKTQQYIPPGMKSESVVSSQSTSTLVSLGSRVPPPQSYSAGPSAINPQVEAQSNNSPETNKSWTLFGIQAKRKTLELTQIGDKDYPCNGFFRKLRETYKDARGFWRLWFSFWQFSHCNFVKVIYKLLTLF